MTLSRAQLEQIAEDAMRRGYSRTEGPAKAIVRAIMDAIEADVGKPWMATVDAEVETVEQSLKSAQDAQKWSRVYETARAIIAARCAPGEDGLFYVGDHDRQIEFALNTAEILESEFSRRREAKT